MTFLPFCSTWSSPHFCLWCSYFCVLCLLAIVLSVLLITASDYPFGICKLSLFIIYVKKMHRQWLHLCRGPSIYRTQSYFTSNVIHTRNFIFAYNMQTNRWKYNVWPSLKVSKNSTRYYTYSHLKIWPTNRILVGLPSKMIVHRTKNSFFRSRVWEIECIFVLLIWWTLTPSCTYLID